ncbi:MAG: hypothetical protein HY927_10140 [Elusimicrobia bacterium]|nr:hypothetical protein [Elusimicrobiota bacterium]
MNRHLLASAVACAMLGAVAAPVLAADEAKPINVIAELAGKDPKVRVDMAKRFGRLILDGDGGKASYVAAEMRKDGMDKRLAKMAEAWVDKKFKLGTSTALYVSELYYVLGDDAPPSWAQSSADLKGALGGIKKDTLITNLKPWTGEPDAGQNPGVKAGQLTKGAGDVTDWANRFLDAAAEYAHQILVAGVVPKNVKVGEIVGHEQPNPVMGGIGGAPRRPTADGSFGPDDLFRGGARTMLLYKDGDKTSREISVKMVSRQTESGAMVDEVGICDVTLDDDRFCRRFPITPAGGSSTFQLDDRQPGKRSYTLSFEPNQEGKVVMKFSREGCQDGKGGSVIETSVEELAQLRAQQAVAMNQLVTINGQGFYVLGQTAGSGGEHLYFPAGIKGNLSSDDPQALSPQFAVTVVNRAGNRDEIVTRKITLGDVGGKTYHTVYDPATRRFNIGEGKGDPPPANPGTGGTNPGTGGTNPSTGGTNPSTGGTNPSTGGTNPVQETEEQRFLKAGYYAPNVAVNEKVKPEGLLRVHSITPSGEEWLKKEYNDGYRRRHILVIPEVGKVFYVAFLPAKQGGLFKDKSMAVILDSKYLMTVSDGGVVYIDLKSKPNANDGFAKAGAIRYGEENVMTLEDIPGADLALVKHAIMEAGLNEAEAKEAMANLATVSKGKKLESVRGAKATGLVAVFSDPAGRAGFWPKIVVGGDTGGNFPDATGKGSTIFEGASGGPWDPFKDTATVGPTDKAEKLGVYGNLKKPHAVLYVNDVHQGHATKDKPRKWFVMFNFSVQGKPYRSAFIEIPLTEGGEGLLKFPYGANPGLDINGDGITKLSEAQAKLDLMTSGTQGRWVTKPDADAHKGVYAVFATKAQDPKDKKENCLGPLFWWGMTQEAAQKACENDSY